jgi:hypothetical protein
MSPNEEGRKVYEKIHQEYQRLYPALKEGFERMGRLG